MGLYLYIAEKSDSIRPCIVLKTQLKILQRKKILPIIKPSAFIFLNDPAEPTGV